PVFVSKGGSANGFFPGKIGAMVRIRKPDRSPALWWFLAALAGGCLEAQEWTRFRGPNGTGISTARTIPTMLGASNLVWKTDLSGAAHSSPVLWGNRLFVNTTSGDGGGFVVVCLDADQGDVLWKNDFPLEPFSKHKFNSFASSSPVVDAERVYALWGEPDHYRVAALDHAGKRIWERDLGPFVSQHGPGISPMLYEDRIIVGNEQDGESSILALEAKTGKTLWQTPRRSAVAAYSTPCVYQPDGGEPALIFNSQAHGIYAVRPADGRVLWEFDQAFDKRSVSSPVLAGNVILGSCGSGGGGSFVTAVRPGDPANGRAPALAYQVRKSAPYVPTSVSRDGLAWLWSDGGIVTCIAANTGEIRYQERVGGNFFGSPVWVDGRLFCVSTSGEIVVLKAGDSFEVLHRYPLGELCHTTPAVARERMFVRTETRLIALGAVEHR
ncbi:MAG: PQQ-binding-like beta-propeller repeat protein, partial [Verrucomicrobiae bacterium]|nr:PQQ-binding-like beta-propeller repeat protein [Verrucomicrobiae bacterium]